MKKEEKKEEGLEKAAKEAMDELETIEKSLEEDKPEETPVDELEKALDEADEALKKSDDKDADDEGGDKDKDEEEDAEEDDGMKKSLEEIFGADVANDLIKASDAYAALEKQVDGLQDTVTALNKSVDLLIAINTKQARVTASLAKSISKFGERPLKKSTSQVGIGGVEETIQKSKSEVGEILAKALKDGNPNVPPDFRSFMDVYGVEETLKRIPESTLGELGLK